MKVKILFALALAVFAFSAVSAHEYWFEPEAFFLPVNQATAVHLYVGDGLIKDREERPYQREKTVMFRLFAGSEKRDLSSGLTDGAMPVYNFSAAKTGNYLLAMERNWSYITLEAQKFEDYLREDGLDYILTERERLGERQKAGRERYSRFIKTLLQVGDKHDDTYRQLVGLKLEIMPLENPYAKKVGDSLKVQVLFDGKPLAGRVVFADNRDSQTQKMTTDKNGKAAVKLDHDGLWLIRLVNMERCAADCGNADWQSYWGALTFGIK